MPTAAAHRPTPENLQAAIDALTQDERAAIEAAFSGLSYAEIAANQAQSVGTIKKRVRSGLAKLRESLRERGMAP
jgi:DNA-directed RNA polymerase specialized sigma24 family protein